MARALVRHTGATVVLRMRRVDQSCTVCTCFLSATTNWHLAKMADSDDWGKDYFHIVELSVWQGVRNHTVT